MELLHHSFEVIPTGWDRKAREGLAFEPVVFDVPALVPGDLGRSARRAYFSAMAHCASHGVDVDGFEVYVWDDETGTGSKVGPQGIDA